MSNSQFQDLSNMLFPVLGPCSIDTIATMKIISRTTERRRSQFSSFSFLFFEFSRKIRKSSTGWAIDPNNGTSLFRVHVADRDSILL